MKRHVTYRSYVRKRSWLSAYLQKRAHTLAYVSARRNSTSRPDFIKHRYMYNGRGTLKVSATTRFLLWSGGLNCNLMRKQ